MRRLVTRIEDLRPGPGRLFVVNGKGGHQRLIPISGRFFRSVATYTEPERPTGADTDRLFVVLKGPPRAAAAPPR